MDATDFVGAVLAAGCSSTQLPGSTQASTSLANVRRLVVDHGADGVAKDLQQHVVGASTLACKVSQ